MLTYAFLTHLAAAQSSGAAELAGTDCPATGPCNTYVVELNTDGTFDDSYSRGGTYTLLLNAVGVRVLTLDMGRLGVTQLTEGPSSCWEEATPPVNPGLGQLAICLTPKEHHVAHYDPTCDDTANAPIFVYSALQAEDGHWNAGRVTPASANGFWVHEVGYYLFTDPLFQNAGCTGLDHKVQVFVGSAAAAPPASPTVIQEWDVDGASLVDEYSKVTVELDDPLFVQAGQSVYVSVQMLNDGSDVNCISSCGTGTPDEDHNYWSGAVSAPYSWYDLEPYGYYDLMVWAEGIAANP